MDAVDQTLLSRLLDEHGSALVLYAQQWCDAPEDAVQEAFLRLVRQRPVPNHIVGWLYRVVRNESISMSRTRTRRARREAMAVSRREKWFNPSHDSDIDPMQAIATLTELPTDLREVIVLRIWSGLSYDEIAQVIGKSTSTAQRRYELGLQVLRQHWNLSCPNHTNHH